MCAESGTSAAPATLTSASSSCLLPGASAMSLCDVLLPLSPFPTGSSGQNSDLPTLLPAGWPLNSVQ